MSRLLQSARPLLMRHTAAALLLCFAASMNGATYTLVLDEDDASEEQPAAMSTVTTFTASSAESTVPLGAFSSEAAAWCYAHALEAPYAFDKVAIKKSSNADPPAAANSNLPLAARYQLAINTGSGDASDFATVLSRNGATPQAAPSDQLLQSSVTQLTKDELFTVGRDAPKNTQGVPALEEFIRANPTDTRANQARLRLARRLMGRKDYDGATALLNTASDSTVTEEKVLARWLGAYVSNYKGDASDAADGFRVVAQDETAPTAIRLDAARRLAGAAHTAHDYPAAWLAFDAIAKDTSDATAQGEALMEQAGLAFEMKKLYDVGSWDEVRDLCAKASSHAGITHGNRATAELMRCETYFEQAEYERALNEFDPFLSAYSDVTREASMAMLWKGICLTRLRRLDEARTVLETVSALDLDGKPRFSGEEPRASALSWLVWIAKEKRDLEAAEEYAADLKARFPDSSESARAESILANLRLKTE